MYKSPTKPLRSRQKVVLPRISLASRTRSIQVGAPRRPNTQSPPNDLPHLSAKSWILYHQNQDRVLAEFNSRQKREMASLTKIMTAICAVQICKQFDIDVKETVFRITYMATNIIGTLANLSSYEWISVEDCLYGLMLPSGNDAALVLAENLGALLVFRREGQLDDIAQINSLDLTEDEQNFEVYVKEFVEYMNVRGKQLGLKSTYFMNPHGLDSYGHFSTCQDVLLLTSYFLQYELLVKIANTKYHTCVLNIYRNQETLTNKIHWVNTNKLLGKKGCKGVKTGATYRAGGCLATSFQMNGEQFLVIVMGCKVIDDRFLNTVKLLRWASQQLQLSSPEM